MAGTYSSDETDLWATASDAQISEYDRIAIMTSLIGFNDQEKCNETVQGSQSEPDVLPAQFNQASINEYSLAEPNILIFENSRIQMNTI
jgi:hypothetical protein